jgi:uncharacterized protein
MIIDLANVGVKPKAIELTIPADGIDLAFDGFVMNGEARFRGVTDRIDDKAHVRGTIEADVWVDCTRCLEPVRKDLEFSFDAIFVDPADEPGEVEIALEAEQLDESVAEGGKIDVAEVVREQILLALPDQQLCKEDCLGLCPICGGNRNLIDCKCEESDIDPRWSALKDLI